MGSGSGNSPDAVWGCEGDRRRDDRRRGRTTACSIARESDLQSHAAPPTSSRGQSRAGSARLAENARAAK